MLLGYIFSQGPDNSVLDLAISPGMPRERISMISENPSGQLPNSR